MNWFIKNFLLKCPECKKELLIVPFMEVFSFSLFNFSFILFKNKTICLFCNSNKKKRIF